ECVKDEPAVGESKPTPVDMKKRNNPHSNRAELKKSFAQVAKNRPDHHDSIYSHRILIPLGLLLRPILQCCCSGTTALQIKRAPHLLECGARRRQSAATIGL